MSQPTTQRTAIEAYEQSHIEAESLLDELYVMLGDMPQPDGETPINWGHVGSLRHAIQQLRDVEQHLKGMVRS
jgi:hypothetical protein